MVRVISIGNQDFEKIRVNKYFYIDKTELIREWWESGDEVTLITRPRRFGKTLNMSMLEQFFLSDMREGAICLRDFLFGRMKSTGSCRGFIRFSVCLLLM